jgi:hypothetical protein
MKNVFLESFSIHHQLRYSCFGVNEFNWVHVLYGCNHKVAWVYIKDLECDILAFESGVLSFFNHYDSMQDDGLRSLHNFFVMDEAMDISDTKSSTPFQYDDSKRDLMVLG